MVIGRRAEEKCETTRLAFAQFFVEELGGQCRRRLDLPRESKLNQQTD